MRGMNLSNIIALSFPYQKEERSGQRYVKISEKKKAPEGAAVV